MLYKSKQPQSGKNLICVKSSTESSNRVLKGPWQVHVSAALPIPPSAVSCTKKWWLSNLAFDQLQTCVNMICWQITSSYLHTVITFKNQAGNPDEMRNLTREALLQAAWWWARWRRRGWRGAPQREQLEDERLPPHQTSPGVHWKAIGMYVLPPSSAEVSPHARWIWSWMGVVICESKWAR